MNTQEIMQLALQMSGLNDVPGDSAVTGLGTVSSECFLVLT